MYVYIYRYGVLLRDLFHFAGHLISFGGFPKWGYIPLVIIRCFLGSSNKKLRFGDPHCALNRRHLLAKGLREFDLRNADCRNDFDREFIYAGIIQWLLGSLRGQKSRSATIF